jgi:hypothetical protein
LLFGAVGEYFGGAGIDAKNFVGCLFAFEAEDGNDVLEKIVSISVLKDQPILIVNAFDGIPLR